MSKVVKDIWLDGVTKVISDHCDERDDAFLSTNAIDLLVIHNISLPPAEKEQDFDNNNVEAFFSGRLQANAHPYFEQIADLKVSAHLYIKRTGEVVQFVPLNKRAWHAGVSEFKGRVKCNDFSIGIEMQGTDYMPFTEAQYQALVAITKEIRHLFVNIKIDNIVGHQDIAPGRKTDPGQYFDWTKYKSQL